MFSYIDEEREYLDMREKPYAPAYEGLKVAWYPTSGPILLSEVVGMHVDRYGDGQAYKAYCSDGVVYKFPEELEKFLSIRDERLFFVSGVDKELEPILKCLGERNCANLLDGYTVYIGGVGVSYRSGCLYTRLAGGRALRKIWTLKPFYPLNMLPEDNDCYGVQALGVRLVRTLLEGELPLKFTSCGAVLSGLGSLPFDSAPPAATEMAYNAYHGGWIEAMKLGHFRLGYDYDLSAAYPTEAAGLVSCSPKNGSWIHAKQVVQEAVYGFCYCLIEVDIGLPFSPIMLRTRAYMTASGRYPIRSVRNPAGRWYGWLTLDELKFIIKNWLGRVEIIDGWWFAPNHAWYPFKSLLEQLSRIRQHFASLEDKLGRNIGKVVAASLQGKMMQSFVSSGKRVSGNAFNPVYAATITSRVRLKVAEVALENCDDILMVMVDGLLATKPLAVPKQWRLEHQGECVVANHGDYDIVGRDVSVPLRQVLGERRSLFTYPLRAPRYTSLSEALEARAFWAAGQRRPETLARVSRVGKRSWNALPKVCGDLLTKQFESLPLYVTQRSNYS